MKNKNLLSGSWHGLLLTAFLAVVFGPIFILAFNSVKEAFIGHHADWLSLILPEGRTLDLFIQSILFALGVSLSAMGIGIMAALFLWQKKERVIFYSLVFLVVLFAIPSYVHSLAWLSFSQGLSSLLTRFGLSGVAFEGWFASWWIQTVTLLPLGISLAMLGFYSVSPELIDASRLSQPGLKTFFKVVLPLASPALFAGLGLIFVLSVTEYSIPSLFSKSVYALEIFAEYSANSIAAKAFFLSVPLLLAAAGAVVFSQASLRNTASGISSGLGNNLRSLVFPSWFSGIKNLAASVAAIAIFFPLITLVFSAGSFRQIMISISAAQNEIRTSFFVSLASAILSLPLAWAAANELLSEKRSSWLWWLAVALPLAIPASLVGIGLVSLYNRAGFTGLYASSGMLVLASLSRFCPFVALVMLAQLKRIDKEQLEACRIFQKDPLHGWQRVKCALYFPALFVALVFGFALSLGELGASLVVAPPGKATLTMRIYNYMHYGSSKEVAGLCLVIAFLLLAAGFAAVLVLNSKKGRT